MEKTLTMVVNDTKMSLAEVCNNSQLPACILELLVKNLYEELRTLAMQQLQQDFISAQNNDDNDNNQAVPDEMQETVLDEHVNSETAQ